MTTAKPDSTTLTCELSRITHALATELHAALAELGTTPRVHSVLCNAVGAELTQVRLAELCSLDKTTMVTTLDELEKSGLVKRVPSPTDRRARIVTVTAAGKKLLAKADRIVADIQDDVLGSLPARERDHFLSAIHRLAENRLSAPVACDRNVRRRAG